MYVHVHKYILMYVCTYMNDVHVHVHTLSTNKQTLYSTCKYTTKHSFIKNKTNTLLTHFHNLLKHEHITPELILVS